MNLGTCLHIFNMHAEDGRRSTMHNYEGVGSVGGSNMHIVGSCGRASFTTIEPMRQWLWSFLVGDAINPLPFSVCFLASSHL
jgi:hypothetical protein